MLGRWRKNLLLGLRDRMPLDPIFDRSFAPLRGLPCWQVKRGYGSFITLEFGEPHLEIREPKVPAPEWPPKVRESVASRKVTVRGEWHLWVYCCSWSILDDGKLIGTSEDNHAAIDSAISRLDGQALAMFSADSSAGSEFAFDLGGRLSTSPYDTDSEQWMLFQPDGHVLSFRADSSYSYSSSTTKKDTEDWLPAWTPSPGS